MKDGSAAHMPNDPTRMPVRHAYPFLSVLVLLIFSVLCVIRFRQVFGDDLTSSYLGCQVLAAGQAEL